jgi:uncharacterized protein YbjQ (UPF0145 family)
LIVQVGGKMLFGKYMKSIVVNTDFVPGKEIVAVLGLVKGNVIQAKHLGKDIAAGFRHIAGAR